MNQWCWRCLACMLTLNIIIIRVPPQWANSTQYIVFGQKINPWRDTERLNWIKEGCVVPSVTRAIKMSNIGHNLIKPGLCSSCEHGWVCRGNSKHVGHQQNTDEHWYCSTERCINYSQLLNLWDTSSPTHIHSLYACVVYFIYYIFSF